MKRWLFNFAAVICTLMCIGVILYAFICGDRQHYYGFIQTNPSGSNTIWSARTQKSGITVTRSYYRIPETLKRTAGWNHRIVSPAAASSLPLQSSLWFHWETYVATIYEGAIFPDIQSLFIPGWFFLLVLAILPALWLVRRRSARKRYRIAKGLSLVCGYDLRATPDRCPECGTIPSERAKAEG